MSLRREHFEELTKRSPDIIVGDRSKGPHRSSTTTAPTDSLGYASVGGARRVRQGIFYPSVEEAAASATRCAARRTVAVRRRATPSRRRFVARNGEEIPVAISGDVLYDENDGVEDGTIGFAKDLREILHKDQLATLGEVAIGLSHEINNPLAVIVNQVDAARERGRRSSPGRSTVSVENERLDAIRREVGRITEVLRRLTEMVERTPTRRPATSAPKRMVDLRSDDA